jgi:acylphosphatase
MLSVREVERGPRGPGRMGNVSTGMARREVVYRGRVQGVGFRATAREIAAGIAVSGWVRNEADGSVRLQVQGAADQVESFLADVRRIMGRRIESEDGIDVGVEAGETGFEIRR